MRRLVDCSAVLALRLMGGIRRMRGVCDFLSCSFVACNFWQFERCKLNRTICLRRTACNASLRSDDRGWSEGALSV